GNAIFIFIKNCFQYGLGASTTPNQTPKYLKLTILEIYFAHTSFVQYTRHFMNIYLIILEY
ncbi:MAG: hypothetical protein RBT05_07085, partial [Bacteroidales bacterium]|nr:hypothetical protein [Bacteroidales bacterium]